MNSRRDEILKAEWAQDSKRRGLEDLTCRAPWTLGTLGHTAQPCEARSVAVYRALRALPRRVRRALQRKFARSLAEVALLLALGQGTVWADTINVDGTTCTIVNAIRTANTDTDTGGCVQLPAATAGADTIVLTLGSTHTLTTAIPSIFGDNGLPLVTSTITIAGNGSTITRDSGAPAFRLLAVGTGGNLTLQKLTLQGGLSDASGGAVYNYATCTVTDSTITGNTSTGGGGGVKNGYQNNRTLTITNSTVSGNVSLTRGGGGVYNGGTFTLTNSTVSGNRVATNQNGGGVENYAGTATIIQSTVSGNTAFTGGGIYIFQGSVTVIQSAIANNTATEIIATTTAVPRGGGLYNRVDLTLANTTVTGNTAYLGGGVYNGGSLTLTNTTVSGNTVDVSNGKGGGIYNDGILTVTTSTFSGNSAYCGGGLYNSFSLGSSLSLTNSTVSGNSASCAGGGLYNDGTTSLTHTTISLNVAGEYGGGVDNFGAGSDLTLVHTLVSGNTASTGPEVDNVGTVTSNAFNLFGHDSDNGVYGFTPTVPTDIVPSQTTAQILNSTLAFNGGRTQNHALVSGSAAINAVTDTTHGGPCPATDQRGFVRNVGNCDVGAVEFGASAPPVVNSKVTFAPQLATFSTSTDPDKTLAACGPGFAGTFFFQARLTKKAVPVTLPLAALKVAVTKLSNGNQLGTADGGNGGVGARQTLPQVGAFSDEALSGGETLDVPFVVCLKNLNSFSFFVNVLGL